jgi:protoporphyrinogen oxidase
MSERRRILVVGGGYTGLTAALRLSSEPGCAVSVVERSPDLGGLAGGFALGGTSLEKTYHHLFRTDTDILGLAEELGIADKLVWHDSSLGILFGGRIYPFTSPLDLLRFRPCSLLSRVRLGLVVLYLQKRKDWRSLAAQTAYDWMARACGDDAMRAVWGPLLKGKFDRYSHDVSMAWLWARIHVRANSRRTGGGGEQLGYFEGGFDVLTRALRQRLVERGVDIRTGTAVEQLAADVRRAKIQDRWEDFDACVFTGPSYALARLLPEAPALEAYARQLRSVNYLSAVCLVFTSDQTVGEQYWLNVNEPNAPFLVFLRHTRLVSPDWYGGRQVYYIGAYLPPDHPLLDRTDDEIASQWWGYLRRIHPEFDPGRVMERHLFRFAGAQHIVDTTYESRIPPYRTPLPGVYLANFSQIFPEDRGTNYAVREGGKITALVADDLRGKGSNRTR